MPVTIGTLGVTFNDGSIQATAATGFSNIVIFTSSGTFNATALGVTKARIMVVGGGGGGGSSNSTQTGKSGGSGGFAEAIVSGLSGSYAVTVGAGGDGANGFVNSNAPAGQASSFGTLLTATGGNGGGWPTGGNQPISGAGTVSAGTTIRAAPSGGASSTMWSPFIGNANTSQTANSFSVTGSASAGLGGNPRVNNSGIGGTAGIVVVEY
jgi:hypothetical protein